MDDADLLKIWLMQMVGQFPVLLVCLVAGLAVLSRWRQLLPGSLWALLGFGLGAALVMVVPLANVLAQRYVTEHMLPMAQAGTLFGVLAFVWSIFHAVAYGFLLTAILVRRPQAPLAPPPPLPPDVTILR